jgi:glycosyltransferase involved in cell wall biosynthesis
MKVSIIISNYNYAKYLPFAVESVIAQTYQNIEIIIVDDGSLDNSREVISQLQEKYPTYIKAIFQTNQGQGGAFNAGFAAASGELIAFLDADDTWKPHKLTTVVEAFNKPDIVGVMHHLDTIDGQGNILDTNPAKPPKLSEDLAQVILDTGNAWAFPPTSGLTYRRSALEKVFPMNTMKWRIWADGCLIYCTAFLGKIKTLEQELGSYRIHGENNHMKSTEATSQQEAKSLAGIEMTNQYINDFLESINYPRRVSLYRNLQYRRTKYYSCGKWNAREALVISRLILGWRFYTFSERIYYLSRFLMKSAAFLIRPSTNVDITITL